MMKATILPSFAYQRFERCLNDLHKRENTHQQTDTSHKQHTHTHIAHLQRDQDFGVGGRGCQKDSTEGALSERVFHDPLSCHYHQRHVDHNNRFEKLLWVCSQIQRFKSWAFLWSIMATLSRKQAYSAIERYSELYTSFKSDVTSGKRAEGSKSSAQVLLYWPVLFCLSMSFSSIPSSSSSSYSPSERSSRKTSQRGVSRQPASNNIACKLQQIELPAKLLDYFLRSNEATGLFLTKW